MPFNGEHHKHWQPAEKVSSAHGQDYINYDDNWKDCQTAQQKAQALCFAFSVIRCQKK